MFGLTNVLVSPARTRYVDRAGQGVALPRLAAMFAGLLCVLAGLTASTRLGGAVLVAVAALAGLTEGVRLDRRCTDPADATARITTLDLLPLIRGGTTGSYSIVSETSYCNSSGRPTHPS